VSANVFVKPLAGLSLMFGLGVEHLLVFGQRGPEGEPPPTLPMVTRWRGFVQLAAEAVFDDAEGRWDRRHALLIDGHVWTSTANTQMGDVRASYQKVFAFGWHDLWIKGRGRWLVGDVPYPYEEPLGEYLRAVFGNIYTRAVVGARAEFRFSLTRDLYKVGLFVDGATYAERDPITGLSIPRFGVAVGPGFHALVEGMFQVDVNVSLGFQPPGRFNLGLFVMLYKIY
jgi:hypothetical protein